MWAAGIGQQLHIAMIGLEPVERSNQGYATQGFLPFQSLLTIQRNI